MSLPARIIPALIIVSLAACSDIPPPPSLQSVIQAAENGLFVGVDKYTEASLEITFKHQGPFSQVKQLNFTIENGTYKDMAANVIIAEHKDTGNWEVIHMMVNNNGRWQTVPKTRKVGQ